VQQLKPIRCACGIVIDQSGAPIDDVTVTLFKDGKTVAVVHGEEDGKFSFDVSQSGNYEIEAKKLGFGSLRFPVVIVKPPNRAGRTTPEFRVEFDKVWWAFLSLPDNL
jgi:hypothetical protein